MDPVTEPFEEKKVEPRLDWYEVIDNFYPVMGVLDTVLLPRERAGTDLHIGVSAAMAATAGGLKSLDWARRAYVDTERLQRASQSILDSDLLRRAYKTSLSAILESRARLTPSESGATPGEFAASVALERFPTTMKSIHMLYRLGHLVDADVVARAGLEQLAWSLAASTARSETDLEGISSSAEIAGLRRLYPAAGRLYGRLSHSAHMNVAEHLGRVANTSAGTMIFNREGTLEWGSTVLLRLGDAWVLVWEISQAGHLPFLEHVAFTEDGPQLLEDRPFAQRATAVAHAIRTHIAERAEEAP